MSRFICCVLFFAFCSAAFSQRIYFVYLQSEAEQPFFVKIGEQTYSSTPAGYLVLSQLKDSSYTIKVGFPQNKWPDQQFSIAIKSKDHGYLVKNFGEKGWGLFDLQSMSVQMAENNSKAVKKELREVSAFTEILSKAANDPSLREKPVFAVAKNDQKTENVSPAVINEQNNSTSQPVNELKTAAKTGEKATGNVPASAVTGGKDVAKQPDSSAKLVVKKADSASSKTEIAKKETRPVITDSQVVASAKQQPDTNAKGTIRQQDPVTKTEVVKKETRPAAIDSQSLASAKEESKTPPIDTYKKSIVTKKSESSTTDGFGLTFIDQHADGQKDTIQILIPNAKEVLAKESDQRANEKKFLDITDEESKPIGSKAIAKNSCSSVASENDFLKLRKKMAGQKTEEAMIEEAKKGFKAKCYTTEQIKNLGNLFLNEAGKFQFYEAVYPYSSDRDNFTVLQTELKDNYFIHRFKNLVTPGSL
jgi:hypothetical protein